MPAPLGYQWLIEQLDLRALPLDACAHVGNTGANGSGIVLPVIEWTT